MNDKVNGIVSRVEAGLDYWTTRKGEPKREFPVAIRAEIEQALGILNNGIEPEKAHTVAQIALMRYQIGDVFANVARYRGLLERWLRLRRREFKDEQVTKEYESFSELEATLETLHNFAQNAAEDNVLGSARKKADSAVELLKTLKRLYAKQIDWLYAPVGTCKCGKALKSRSHKQCPACFQNSKKLSEAQDWEAVLAEAMEGYDARHHSDPEEPQTSQRSFSPEDEAPQNGKKKRRQPKNDAADRTLVKLQREFRPGMSMQEAMEVVEA